MLRSIGANAAAMRGEPLSGDNRASGRSRGFAGRCATFTSAVVSAVVAAVVAIVFATVFAIVFAAGIHAGSFSIHVMPRMGR